MWLKVNNVLNIYVFILKNAHKDHSLYELCLIQVWLFSPNTNVFQEYKLVSLKHPGLKATKLLVSNVLSELLFLINLCENLQLQSCCKCHKERVLKELLLLAY